ncbi:glycoside hydrolase family 3 N-terminal domain-containing protein [Cohaesibacter celericrescens]|uniref:beta-N-acetylhexosaminidase n=1 Tax=Cohaesibacter celericrescens TaxID=2067669 RepID=A0A2N5XKI1_9HYPH|nr:glycoside hydrolase family 3 N-terminal domain-containing protein [Cohaesibacter celericrescens]PLW75012.1 glycosyl hydrolase [Cohaesibacter celericrescens]
MSQTPFLSRRSAMKCAAGALAAPVLIKSTIANAADLERAIGQLIMVGFSGKSAQGRFVRTIAAHVAKGRAASVVYLGSNIGSGRDVLGLNKLFHGAGIKHIAIDHEGGAVQRLKQKQGYTRIPSALELAQSKDVAGVEKVYAVAAKELANAGFTLNLGPVADLHRSFNPVIGKNRRAYAADATTVVAYAGAFVRAHRRYGLQTSLKHFPGHGLSNKDSHNGFVDIRESWDPEELQPFSMLIRQGLADIVMTGHLFVRITERDNGELTTFSRTLVQDVLRGGLQFRGLTMTDDLDMGAVRKMAEPREAVLRAVEAGYDILLLSNSLKPNPDLPAEAIGWIRSAIQEGRIRENQIFQSAERVQRSRSA